jgi:hypothetical protein
VTAEDANRDTLAMRAPIEPPTAEPEPLAQPEALAQPEQPEPPEPPAQPEPTPLELQRRLAAASQPKPWQPSDAELDPTSDVGWGAAAEHELPAIRPEDLPATLTAATTAAGATDNLIELPPPDQALAPSERRWRRGARRMKRGLAAAARPAMLIAIFAGGVALGWSIWMRNAPLPPSAAGGQAVSTEPGTTANVPPQVQSLIAALTADNQTQLQVVVPAEPYRLIAGELARRDVAKIAGARAFSTYENGPDSATEILVGGTNSTGDPVVFNLVVHLQNGVITEFR